MIISSGARRCAVLGRYASAGKDAEDSADSPTCLALNLANTDVGRPARRLMRAKRREWSFLPSNPGDLSDRFRPALQRWIQERREPWWSYVSPLCAMGRL